MSPVFYWFLHKFKQPYQQEDNQPHVLASENLRDLIFWVAFSMEFTCLWLTKQVCGFRPFLVDNITDFKF